MKNKGQLNLGSYVIMFVGIIFAIALLVAVSQQTGLMTQKQTISNQTTSVVGAFVGDNEVNESVNFTIYTQSTWKQSDCPLTSVTIRNGAGTELTATTDYTLYASQGVYSLVNTTDTVPDTSLNLTYVDYTYCADGYNKDSSSRSIANLILIFGALALLAFVLEYSGITNWTGMFR